MVHVALQVDLRTGCSVSIHDIVLVCRKSDNYMHACMCVCTCTQRAFSSVFPAEVPVPYTAKNKASAGQLTVQLLRTAQLWMPGQCHSCTAAVKWGDVFIVSHTKFSNLLQMKPDTGWNSEWRRTELQTAIPDNTALDSLAKQYPSAHQRATEVLARCVTGARSFDYSAAHELERVGLVDDDDGSDDEAQFSQMASQNFRNPEVRY